MELAKNKELWQAWIWIKWKPGTPGDVWESWKTNSQVKNAWSTQGQWDCVLAINANNPDAVESFVWNTIRKNNWVQDTSTTWTKQWW